MVDRYGSEHMLVLADRDKDGVVDEAVVQLALDDASSDVDTILEIATPLDPVPHAVEQPTCAIARELLATEADKLTKTISEAAEKARTKLRELKEGGTLDQAPAPEAHMDAPERLFTRETTAGLL